MTRGIVKTAKLYRFFLWVFRFSGSRVAYI